MIAPGAVALVSSQNAPEYTTVIPHEHTYVASDILQSLNCSDNICGCHLLHSLCNDPFNKPLHPPLSLRLFPLFDPGAVALVSSQSAPERTV